MLTNNKFLQTALLVLSAIVILACSLVIGPPQTEPPDSSAMQTSAAFGMMSTSLANQQMTLQALQVQAQATGQPANLPPPTQTASAPLQQPPTQNIQPPPQPSQTSAPPPSELVLEIQKSVDTFYCYQPPYKLTITVKVSDINRGMAVYYHIRDKNGGAASDDQVIDLHRKTGDTRDATIVGGGSSDQNLQFPPMMGESYFYYQIISDDTLYRSPVYSDITFFPCGQ